MNRLTRKITICLVEDEQSLVEMIQFNLELDGYDIFAIRDGGFAKDKNHKYFFGEIDDRE